MTDSTFDLYLKVDDFDPVKILNDLYEENKTLTLIIHEFLKNLINNLNQNEQNNYSIIDSFNTFKFELLSIFNTYENQFDNIPVFLSNFEEKDQDHNLIWKYLKIKNILKIIENTFLITNYRNKNKSISLFNYLKDREPSFINNNFMKKHSLQTSYVGKTIDQFCFKISKLDDHIDSIINEYNDIIKDKVITEIKKDKDGNIIEDNTDKVNNYNNYVNFVNLNNSIVIIEDLNSLLNCLGEYNYALELLLIPIEDKNGKFNSFNSSLIS